MDRKGPIGDGYSPAALEARWREIDQGLPPRGEGCPTVVELFGLIYGPLPEEETGILQAHLAGCAPCRERLQILQHSALALSLPTLREVLGRPPAEGGETGERKG